MTAGGILGGGAGYNYQSPTMRSLGKITPESYDYRDQTKLISKLVGDVSFMGGMMRKMQKGIDDANQNFVQQIQSLINDFLVLLGGGGDTGLDFGDLKYILQAIGALFGFGDGVLPINLFEAAWHFFSEYILPTENFTEVINLLIDNAIATVLDLFGEIPIVGQALQQLAVIIATIRDTLAPVVTAIDSLFSALGGDFSSGDLGSIGELWDTLNTLFATITAPVAEALAPLWPLISEWTVPFIEALTQVVEVVTNIIDAITFGVNGFDDFVGGAYNPLNVIINLIQALLDGDLIGELVGGGIFDSLMSAGTFLLSLIPGLPTSKITSGTFGQSMITDLITDLADLLPFDLFNAKSKAGTNLVLGGDFEDDGVWDAIEVPGEVFRTTAEKHSGLKSMKVVQTPGGWNGIYSFLDTTTSRPGDVFEIDLWIYRVAGYAATKKPRVYIEFNDSNGVNSTAWLSPGAPLTWTTGWNRVFGKITCPSGYDRMTSWIQLAEVSEADGFATGEYIYVDDVIIREVTVAQNIITQLFGGSSILSTILDSVIPGLPTSKITSGTFAQSMITGLVSLATDFANTLTNLFGGSTVLSQIITGAVPGLPTSKITSGTFPQSMIVGLVTLATDFASTLTNLFGGSTVLSQIITAAVPGLPTSKITSGTFAQAMITNLVSDLGARLLSTVFQASTRAGSNLFLSPTFDDTSIVRVPYGTPAAAGYSTAQKFSGTHSWTWTANGTWAGIFLAPNETDSYIVASPGDKFYVEARAFAPTANNHTSGAQNFFVAAVFKDSSGVNADQFSQINVPLNTFTKNAWQQFILHTSAVPAGFDRVAFVIQTQDTTPSGNVYYIDNIIVREETQEQSILGGLFGGTDVLSNILTSVVPGLPTSKITSGTFAQSMISNLISDLGARLLNSVFANKTTAGSNLVLNGDFEDTTLQMGGSTGSYSTDQKRTGSYSWKFVNTSAWEAVEFHNQDTNLYVYNYPQVGVKVQPGQKYYGEVYIRPHASNTKPTPFLNLQITISDSLGVSSPTIILLQQTTAPLTAGTWTKFSGYGTIPTGFDRANLSFQVTDVSAVGDTYYLDNALLREETAAANIKPLFNNVDILSGAYDYTQTLFTGASQAAQNLLDSFAQKLGGVNGASLPIANYQQVALNTANTIAASSAAIASMQQKLNQSPTIGGLSYLHDFSLDADSSGVHADFVRTYSGAGSRAFQTAGGTLKWVGGSGTRNVAIDLNTIITTTDYQMIGIPFASDPGSYYDHPNWWTSGTWHYGYQWITGRKNSAGTQYVRLTMRADGYLEFGYINGGSYTILDTKAAGTFNWYNGVYYLVCGTAGNIRTFQLVRNGVVLWSFTDGSAVTALGASNRSAGCGEYADDYLQGSPILALSLSDNTPAVVTGSCARFYRASTTGVSHGTNIGGGAFANSFFDTTDYKTSDITWTPASGNSITVSQRGTYILTVAWRRANTAAVIAVPCFLVNGTPKRFGGYFGGQTTETNATFTCCIALQPGDVVQPGYTQNNTINFSGTAAGNETYVEITKVGAI